MLHSVDSIAPSAPAPGSTTHHGPFPKHKLIHYVGPNMGGFNRYGSLS